MLSAVEIAAGVRDGKLSPVEVVAACLRAIDAQEPQLEAWVHIDREGALAAARAIESEGRRDGALLGVPVGVKDIFDVAGMPTTLGAGSFAHTAPYEDSTVVGRLRKAGAIILGKTATTAFAFQDPAPTHNPWSPDRTPGGSSSGSAAAVAAGMIPLAIGSQTVGSVLRPSAYCGVVGFKPSKDWVDLEGVWPLTPSFDHAGVIVRSVADAALAYHAAAGVEAIESAPVAPVALGIPRRYYYRLASNDVIEALEGVAVRLASRGVYVREIEMPIDARDFLALGRKIMGYETSRVHAQLFGAHHDEYRDGMRGLIEAGQAVSDSDYAEAIETLAGLREQILASLAGVDALLLPAAPSIAPEGLTSTGDGIFNAPASFTGLPAIALPSGLSEEEKMPLSAQLMAGAGQEERLLAVAGWVEGVIGFRARARLSAD